MPTHRRTVARVSLQVLLALAACATVAVTFTLFRGPPSPAAGQACWSAAPPAARYTWQPLGTPSEDGIERCFNLRSQPQTEVYVGCYSSEVLPTEEGDFRRPSELAGAAAAVHRVPLRRWRTPRRLQVVDSLVNSADGPCLVVSATAPGAEAELLLIDHIEPRMSLSGMRAHASEVLASITNPAGRRCFAGLPRRPRTVPANVPDDAARYRMAGESILVPDGWICYDLVVLSGSSRLRESRSPALWLTTTAQGRFIKPDCRSTLVLRWGRAGRSDGAYRYFDELRNGWLSRSAYAAGSTETIEIGGSTYSLHRWEPVPGRIRWLYHSADLILVADRRISAVTDDGAELDAIAGVLTCLRQEHRKP